MISVTPEISPSRRSSGAAIGIRHGFRIGAGAGGEDDDGGDIDAGQRGDGQEAVGDDAGQQHPSASRMVATGRAMKGAETFTAYSPGNRSGRRSRTQFCTA